jgi:GntR family transcriptional regulator
LPIELRRKSGVPLYVQLKEEIRRQIVAGEWPPGFRLPAERELAALVKVSRNTVSQAYRELETEGMLNSGQGRGTFVSAIDKQASEEARRSRLAHLASDVLEKAIGEGYNGDELLAALQSVVGERRALSDQVRVAFVECNWEQVDFFSSELEQGSGVRVDRLVLQDPRLTEAEWLDRLNAADVVVTTFFHMDEVKSKLETDRPLLPISLDPALETVVAAARIPRGRQVGLVCLSDNFADKVKVTLQNAGINLPIEMTTSRDSGRVREIIGRNDVMLVSPNRRHEVETLLRPGQELIEFVYRPDTASVNLLRSALLEIQESKKRRGS